jgi:hypothetical protein
MTPEKDFATHTVNRITGTIVKVIVFLIVAIVFFGEAVFHLWNSLMPQLFHLPQVSFWQAVGLLFLSWLLFGGLRGIGRPAAHSLGAWRRRGRRWQRLTPEEQEKVREWLLNRGQNTSAAPPKA